MMVEDVKRMLAEILQQEGLLSNFGADTPLLGHIAEFDSMALVTMLASMEERYDIAIDDDEVSAETFATVGTVAEFLQSKIEQ